MVQDGLMDVGRSAQQLRQEASNPVPDAPAPHTLGVGQGRGPVPTQILRLGSGELKGGVQAFPVDVRQQSRQPKHTKPRHLIHMLPQPLPKTGSFLK